MRLSHVHEWVVQNLGMRKLGMRMVVQAAFSVQMGKVPRRRQVPRPARLLVHGQKMPIRSQCEEQSSSSRHK
jgi:hypothetical protein